MKQNFQEMFFNEADELHTNYLSNDPNKSNQFDDRNFYSNITNNTQFLNTKKTFTDKIEKYSSDGLNYTSSQQMKLQDIYTEEMPIDDQEEEDQKGATQLNYDQHIRVYLPDQQSNQIRSTSQNYNSKINSSNQSNNQINSSLSSSYTNYHQKKLKEKYSHFFENVEVNSNQNNLSKEELQSSEKRVSNRNQRFASCDAYSYQHKKSEQDQQNLYQPQQQQKQSQQQQIEEPQTFNIKNDQQQKIIQQNNEELNFLKGQFLSKVEEIQNNLKSIDPYKISLNSIHSNTTNFNQTYIKRQEELNANLLKINQMFEKHNFLDSAGSSEMQNQLNQINMNIDSNKNQQQPHANVLQHKKPPFIHPAGESSIVKTRINQNDFFEEDSIHNNTGQTVEKQQNQQLFESGNVKQKQQQDLKDRSLLDILKKKENLYEKVRRDYKMQKDDVDNRQQKNILQGISIPKEPYKNYSRDSIDRQKIQFYDTFMPSNMRMMKSPYQLLKYKMNNKAKFDIQSCISELASINSSLRTSNYK